MHVHKSVLIFIIVVQFTFESTYFLLRHSWAQLSNFKLWIRASCKPGHSISIPRSKNSGNGALVRSGGQHMQRVQWTEKSQPRAASNLAANRQGQSIALTRNLHHHLPSAMMGWCHNIHHPQVVPVCACVEAGEPKSRSSVCYSACKELRRVLQD